MKLPLKNPFAPKEEDEEKYRSDHNKKSQNDVVIERDSQKDVQLALKKHEKETEKKKKLSSAERSRKKGTEKDDSAKSRNPIWKFAYNLLGGKLPRIPQYKETYEQAGMPLIYEAYLSTGFLLGFIIIIPTFIISFLLELRLVPHALISVSLIGSLVLGAVVFAGTILLWLIYPIVRRRNFKTALENQLAYSFGILGVLASAGMTLDRLFERVATSETNPVLAELAKRFLRDVRLFGLDSESALTEVANHSPSKTFAGMLNSISVAYKTTGTIRDLVMFESARLLQEKTDNLRRSIANLAIMAELYITLVVVGPIIFIVMLAIFGLLPTGGGLPDPIFLINLIVFLGIPVLSVVFILLLDSVVGNA